MHSENVVPQHFIVNIVNMDVPNPGNFHMIYLINLPPCFVQGSLIGGSCIILVPFWPTQPCEFGSRELHVSIVSFWA